MEPPDDSSTTAPQVAQMSLGELTRKIAEVESEISALELRLSDCFPKTELEDFPRPYQALDGLVGGGPPSPEQVFRLLQIERQRVELERQILRQITNLERQRAELYGKTTELERQKADFIARYFSMFTELEPLLERLRLFDVDSDASQDLGIPPAPNLNENSSSRESSPFAGSNTVPISRFKVDFCIGTNSTFEVREWILREDVMLDLIREKLCNSVDTLLDDCTSALNKVRAMYKWLENLGAKISDLTHVQPIFMLLLDYILRKLQLHKSLEVFKGNQTVLEGVLEMNIGGAAKSQKLRGHTDVYVGKSLNTWRFYVELKNPFSKSNFEAAENQLLCQSEVIAQMKQDEESLVLGCLTDLWRIMVNVRRKGGKYERVFYKSNTVINAREYTIRLLLLFCDLSPDDLSGLIKEPAAGDVKFVNSTPSEDSDLGFDGRHDTTKSSAKPMLGEATTDMLLKNNEEMNSVIYFDSDDDSEDLDEVLRFNEWDARRRGVMHLCKRNLDALQEELNSKRQPASNKLLEWLHKRRRLFS